MFFTSSIFTQSVAFLSHEKPSCIAFLTSRHSTFHSSIIPQLLSADSFFADAFMNRCKKTLLLFICSDTMQFASRMSVSSNERAFETFDEFINLFFLPLFTNNRYFSSTLRHCEIRNQLPADGDGQSAALLQLIAGRAFGEEDVNSPSKTASLARVRSLESLSIYHATAESVSAISLNLRNLMHLTISWPRRELDRCRIFGGDAITETRSDHVSTSSVDSKDRSLLKIGTLPFLRSLVFNGISDANDFIDALVRPGPHNNLTSLTIGSGSLMTALDFVDLASTAPKLEELHLNYVVAKRRSKTNGETRRDEDDQRDAAASFDALDGLGDLFELKKLTLENVRCREGRLSFLRTLGRLEELRLLGLTFIKSHDIVKNDEFKHLADLPRLRVFEICGLHVFRDCDVGHLMKKRPNLQHVALNFVGITPDALNILATSGTTTMMNLRFLSLSASFVGGALSMAVAGQLRPEGERPFTRFYSAQLSIRSLNLSKCCLIDCDMKGIENLKHTLEELNMNSNDNITDVGVAHLAGLENLRVLSMNGLPSVTDVSCLSKSLTKLEVWSMGGCTSLASESFRFFARDPTCFPALLELSVNSLPAIDDQFFSFLSKNHAAKSRLRKLNVSAVPALTDRAVCQFISQLKGLQSLVGLRIATPGQGRNNSNTISATSVAILKRELKAWDGDV